MKLKLFGNKKFFKNPNWEKRGDEYVRTKKHTPDDVLKFQAEIKNVKADPREDPETRDITIFGVANSNIVDRMQERLDPRGLDLQDFMRNPVLLAYHDHQRPIGKVLELDIQEDGVYFTGKVGFPEKAKLTEDQKEIRSLIEQGILSAVSVGFIPKKVKYPEESPDGELFGEFIITEWELLELSIVSVPANQGSLFDVKNCKTNNDDVKVKSDTSKASSKSQGLSMLKKLKALKALLVKSKFLVDAEIDEEKKQAKLTFIVDDIKTIEDLEASLKAAEDAEDSKEGMAEALTLLRSIGTDLKTNNDITREIRQMMDKPKDDYEEEEDKPKDEDEEEEGKSTDAKEEGTTDSEGEVSDKAKATEDRIKALEDAQEAFQKEVKSSLDRIGDILSLIVGETKE